MYTARLSNKNILFECICFNAFQPPSKSKDKK